MRLASSEPTLGSVPVAPFVLHAGLARVVCLALRPALSRLRFDRFVANPPVAQLNPDVLVLALRIGFV